MSPSPEEGIRNAHIWFESNSGWAPPDVDEMAEWVADGVCRCPDHCLVTPEGCCDHGLASWWLVLEAQRREDEHMPHLRRAHGATDA